MNINQLGARVEDPTNNSLKTFFTTRKTSGRFSSQSESGSGFFYRIVSIINRLFTKEIPNSQKNKASKTDIPSIKKASIIKDKPLLLKRVASNAVLPLNHHLTLDKKISPEHPLSLSAEIYLKNDKTNISEEVDRFNASTKLFNAEIYRGFTDKEQSLIQNQIIPNLIKIKNFLVNQWLEAGNSKPNLLKVSGKTCPSLSIEIDGKKYHASIKIFYTGVIIYSFPEKVALSGGLKKITIKAISHVKKPSQLELSAKYTLLKKLRTPTHLPKSLNMLESDIIMKEWFLHPNLSATLLHSESSSLSKGGLILRKVHMPLMRPLSNVLQEITQSPLLETPYKYIKNTLFQVVDLISEVIDGIHYLHQDGWIHHDIKPENILVSYETEGKDNHLKFTAKLNDFDLLTKNKEEFLTSEACCYSGTKGFFIKGIPKGKHSDIYALGITIKSLLFSKNFSENSLSLWDKLTTIENYPEWETDPALRQLLRVMKIRILDLIERMTTTKKSKDTNGKIHKVYDNFSLSTEVIQKTLLLWKDFFQTALVYMDQLHTLETTRLEPETQKFILSQKKCIAKTLVSLENSRDPFAIDADKISQLKIALETLQRFKPQIIDPYPLRVI